MKLKSVDIYNFRAIQRLQLRLDPQLTVLHGDNAHGKTSVLGAIALGLGAVPTLLPDVSGIGFFEEGPTRRKGARVSMTTTDEIRWERTPANSKNRMVFEKRRLGRSTSPSIERSQALAGEPCFASMGTPVDLPILAFYDTERAVPHLTKQRGLPKSSPSRYAALAGALSARTSFRELFEWFYAKENEELREQRERRDHDHRYERAVCRPYSDILDD